MKTKSLLIVILTVSILTACAQAVPTTAYPPPGLLSATPTSAYPPPGSKAATPTTGAYPGPTTQPTQSPGLTAAQQAAIQEVSKKYNLPADQIKVVSTESVTWPNGCLGVVIPGVLCTQIVTDGYRIILEAKGQQFEIRTNLDGTNVIDAAQQLATLNFVIRSSENTIQVVNPNIPLGPTYNPAFNGFLPQGEAISGTAYVLDPRQGKAVAVDASGQHDLSFIKNPTYGLAIWRGGLGTQPLIAWGTQLYPDNASSLIIANLDGSNLETLLTVNASATSPVQLVAELWSADGKSLYFSKEPVGIGGYIIFGGASNLYQIDVTTKEVTEIIPQAPTSSPQTCLDAISGDYRFVADHCTDNMITIRDLQAGTTTSLQLPTDFTGYKAMGSARFSPAGDRVAFALAKHNPDDEQGWVAVGKSTGGTAELILTSDPGNYYNVVGWLDDQTLLVQSYSLSNPNGDNQVLAVSADGSTVTKVSDGLFVSVIDNR